MAPENRSSQISTTKSDIFSLGIILFELLTRFDTDMERAVMLNKLRSSGNIPQFLTDQFPVQSILLRELISPVPEERPTAQEIFSSGIFFKDSRRTTISSFGDSQSQSTDDYNVVREVIEEGKLRQTMSAFCIETPNPEELLFSRHRRTTGDWMPWGPSHLVQGEEQHHHCPTSTNFSSSYNPAFCNRIETDGVVSSSYEQKNNLSEADPKLRILALEKDVACLEAKLKAMTTHYQTIESELERSHVEVVGLSSPISNESSSIPIPIPFRK
jgi:hypothetical protein